jgi:hypothetical protein
MYFYNETVCLPTCTFTVSKQAVMFLELCKEGNGNNTNLNLVVDVYSNLLFPRHLSVNRSVHDIWSMSVNDLF